jgi:hypothetical protein
MASEFVPEALASAKIGDDGNWENKFCSANEDLQHAPNQH